MSINFTDNFTVLSATTTTVTAANATQWDVSKRQLKSIVFTATSISSGNGAFGLDVSNDGTNWVTYNRLIDNVTNTNAQNNTRVAAPTLSSNTSNIYFFDTEDYFRYLRVYVTVSVDGSYSAVLQAAG